MLVPKAGMIVKMSRKRLIVPPVLIAVTRALQMSKPRELPLKALKKGVSPPPCAMPLTRPTSVRAKEIVKSIVALGICAILPHYR